MKSLTNKVIWITGASSGIGEALAKELAQHDARLILSARREEELKRVQRELPDAGDYCHILPLDLEQHEEIPGKVEQAIQLFGQVDVLVNNGGISQRSLIEDTDFVVFKRLMDINYLGTIRLTNTLLPHFIERQTGHYVTVTSLMGKFASPLRSGYCGAKHALHGYFDALRLEQEQNGVQITLVCPGFINTNVSKNAFTGDGSPQQKMDNATAKGLSPEACAQKMVKAIQKEKREVYIGKREVMGIYLKRFFPGLLHRVVKRSAVT